MYGKDMDICDQFRNNRWEVVYTGAATIMHYLGRSFEQQSVEILSQAINNGLRAFFEKGSGPFAALVFDMIMLVGFLVRWISFSLANKVSPGKDFDKLSAFSHRYALNTLRHVSFCS